MKKFVAFTFALVFTGLLMAAPAGSFGKHLKLHADKEVGIKFFSGTWAEALEASEKEDKIIFLDAYAAWCGPCKMMTANTFTDAKVGEYFNENFISFKMDMEKNADGPRLSTKYGLRAYPTLYFVNHEEKVVHETVGYHDPGQLIALAEGVVSK
jgi:thioredoxin 1